MELRAMGWIALAMAACVADATPEPEHKSASVAAALTQQAPTAEGVVVGTREADGVMAFLGIPYAAPPVGALRWKAPRPPLRRSAPLDATRPSFICPQTTDGTIVLGDENCLMLNVWTSSLDRNAKRPVMVFIHGGGFAAGWGAIPTLFGDQVAADGAVAVTINYRLGPLGFLAHPALLNTDPEYPATGNYGMLDQVAALRWVRANIASFGGDPNRVVVYGQSAGGFSVCNLAASPLARELMHGAIIMSGSCLDERAMPTLNDPPTYIYENSGLAYGEVLAGRIGCDQSSPSLVRACLRSKTYLELMQGVDMAKFGLEPGSEALLPIVDGIALTDTPSNVLRGLAETPPPPFPIISGILAGDMLGGTIARIEKKFPAFSEAEYAAFLAESYGDLGPALAAAYPLTRFGGDSHLALANIQFDLWGGCTGRRPIHEVDALNGPASSYTYYWDIGTAVHGQEVAPILGTPPLRPDDTADPKGVSYELGASIRASFIEFARTGRPGPIMGVPWPASTTNAPQHIRFSDKDPAADLRVTVENRWYRDGCQVWE